MRPPAAVYVSTTTAVPRCSRVELLVLLGVLVSAVTLVVFFVSHGPDSTAPLGPARYRPPGPIAGI
jgi:hypothetical protein